MRDPLTDDGNVQDWQQWAINGGPPLGQQWRWAGAGCRLRDGAVMSASTGPAPGRHGMLTGLSLYGLSRV